MADTPYGSDDVFRNQLSELQLYIEDSLESQVFLQVESERYFEKPLLFGLEVAERFPEANEDIVEAGTCLALDRGTASVMHLMRVVEVGLKALAAELGLPKRTDWGKHLRDIETELAKRYQTSGCRSSEEAFFSEAAAQIGHIKTAWRNPTMHAEKTYTVKRAEEILIAVRSLVQHLATRLSQSAEAEIE